MRDELREIAKELEALASEIGAVDEWKKSDALDALTRLRYARLDTDAHLREIETQAAKEAFLLEARWGDIARAAGVTRQTAQATYRDRKNKPRRQPTRDKLQPLPPLARRPSARDARSWPEAMAEIETETE